MFLFHSYHYLMMILVMSSETAIFMAGMRTKQSGVTGWVGSTAQSQKTW